MWRKSKQVECAPLIGFLLTWVLCYRNRDELAEIGLVLTKLAGQGDGVVMPSVQRFAQQQQLAWLTATVTDNETAILELERQVAVAETLEKRVRDVETFVAVVDKLETRVGEMEQLKVQREQLSDFVKTGQLVVAEIAEKLQKRVRDVEKLARHAERVHAELSVVQALSRHDSRFTNLE